MEHMHLTFKVEKNYDKKEFLEKGVLNIQIEMFEFLMSKLPFALETNLDNLKLFNFRFYYNDDWDEYECRLEYKEDK